MKRGLFVVASSVVLGYLPIAAGAPGGAPAPSGTTRITPISPRIEVVKSAVDVALLDAPVKCGQPFGIRLRITRKDPTKGWAGNASIALGAEEKSVNVSFVNAPAAHQDVLVQLPTVFDCKKALGKPRIVVKQHATEHGFAVGEVYAKTLSPKSVKMAVGFDPPQPAQASSVWLRRVELANATCGEQAAPTADLMLLGGAAQNASVKLTYGAASADLSALVSPNQVARVQLPATTLDCQAAAGIGGIGYAFSGAIPRSGVVEATEVSYGL